MVENGINVVIPPTDSKTLQAVLKLLDSNKLGIPGMPRLLSAQILVQNINSGKIRVMEKNEATEKTIVGLAITCLLDEANDFGLFSLIFNPTLTVSEPEIIATAIREFKLYYQGKNLSKISVLLVVPATKAMLSLMISCGFIEEAPLGSQFKESSRYKDGLLLSITTNGRETKPLSASTPVEKEQKIEELGLAIKELQEQLAAAKKTVKEMTQNLSLEISELQETPKKKIPRETTFRETKKLGDIAIKILEEVIKHREEITQKEIVDQTGIHQGTVSYNITKVLLPANLIKEVPTGKKRTKIVPNMEKIKQVFPEMLTSQSGKVEITQKVKSALENLGKPKVSLVKGLSLKELGIEPKEAEEFVKAVQATNLCHIIGSPKDLENCFIRLKKIDLVRNKADDVGEKIEPDSRVTTETQKLEEKRLDSDGETAMVISIGEFLSEEREQLKTHFFTQSKFTKAKEEISKALKSGKPIWAEIFGSCYGIRKDEIPAVITLLCKEINADNNERESKSLIKEVKINGAADYGNTTVEIIAAPGISEQKITEDKKEAKKPAVTKQEKTEEEPVRETSEKILAELSQTHREIFFAIKEAGGTLSKLIIKNKVGISKEVLESCVNTMVEKGLLRTELEKVSLSNIA